MNDVFDFKCVIELGESTPKAIKGVCFDFSDFFQTEILESKERSYFSQNL